MGLDFTFLCCNALFAADAVTAAGETGWHIIDMPQGAISGFGDQRAAALGTIEKLTQPHDGHLPVLSSRR